MIITLLALLAASPLDGLDQIYPHLDSLYLDLHRNPELSSREEKTAARLAEELRRLGYAVTTGVGGTGVVGVLRNGKGPTVLLRTELDALPVEEKTGLPYASHVTAPDPSGKIVPVMHACGHDIHMASWAGAAALLVQHKDLWRGTVVMVGQPAEETVKGAEAMVKDGLVTRFPKPDYCIAVHDSHDAPAGKVMVTPGYALANVDSVDVWLYGKSGHGAHPEATVDPVVIAARTVLAWQTLISREKDPLEPAVLTVGSIQGGSKYNIIPDEVHLQITLRTYKPEVRKQMLDGIARIAKGGVAGRQLAEGAVDQDPGKRECHVQRSGAGQTGGRSRSARGGRAEFQRMAPGDGRRGFRHAVQGGRLAIRAVAHRRSAAGEVRASDGDARHAAVPALQRIRTRPRADHSHRRDHARRSLARAARQAHRPALISPA